MFKICRRMFTLSSHFPFYTSRRCSQAAAAAAAAATAATDNEPLML